MKARGLSPKNALCRWMPAAWGCNMISGLSDATAAYVGQQDIVALQEGGGAGLYAKRGGSYEHRNPAYSYYGVCAN